MLWPQVRRPFSCVPPCAGASTYALVLDRAGAQQQLPVRLAGRVGEGRRHAQQVAGRLHQRAVQLGKAQVVADAQADAQRRRPAAPPAALPASSTRAFVVLLAAVVEGEQVHLVVARGQRAVGREDQRAVAHARRRRRCAAAACRRRATAPCCARRVGQEALDRAVARRLGDGQLVVVAPAHQAEVLGQRHQLRAGGGGARDQRARRRRGCARRRASTPSAGRRSSSWGPLLGGVDGAARRSRRRRRRGARRAVARRRAHLRVGPRRR